MKLTRCPHCKQETDHGTHMGCFNCGKVKISGDGKRVDKRAKKR